MDASVSPIVVTVVCMAVCYLVCGIPFGLIIGRLSVNVDIRKAGSGNIGTTNALRAAGPKVAALTLLFDCLKGVLGSIGRWVIAAFGYGAGASIMDPGASGDVLLALVALSCLYGHIFSPYLKFHGGKGMATGVGVLFGFCWPLALLHLGIFIILVAITKYVSVGSIATAALVPVTVIFCSPRSAWLALAIWAVLGWTVVWAHRGNISRSACRHGVKAFLYQARYQDGW